MPPAPAGAAAAAAAADAVAAGVPAAGIGWFDIFCKHIANVTKKTS